METRYSDRFRPVDEDAYLRDFIRAVEHKDIDYIRFVVPIIKVQKAEVYMKSDTCGHYLEISEEDASRYDTVLSHGLMLASHHGAYHIAEYLIEQGTHVNAANKTGDTALLKACERGHRDIVGLLLSSGADINQENLIGSAPLQHISRMSDKLDILDQLLTYQQLNVDQATHKRGRTSLHTAAECDSTGMLCKSLVDRGATVNIRDKDGKTPLHLASERGLLNNVRVLIQYGAYINEQTDKFKLTALHMSMEKCHSDVTVMLLKNGANYEITDSFGENALERMKKYEKLDSNPEYEYITHFVKQELNNDINIQKTLMTTMFSTLCELIPEDKWTKLFEELFRGSETLERNITNIPLRTSEVSLSVLLLHLLNTWHRQHADFGTYWILMRALRDHNMGTIADEMIRTFYDGDEMVVRLSDEQA